METLGQFGAVLLVLALLMSAGYLIRKKQLPSFARELRFASAPKRMQIVERVALTAQHTLCLVRIGDRELLVTTAPGNCQVISTPSESHL